MRDIRNTTVAHTWRYNHRVTTRWLAFVVAAAVAVGAGVWAPRLFAPAGSAPSRTNMVEPVGSTSTRTNTVDSNRGDKSRVVSAYPLPAEPVAAPVTPGDRFKLVGVVAPRESVPAVNGLRSSPWTTNPRVRSSSALRSKATSCCGKCPRAEPSSVRVRAA